MTIVLLVSVSLFALVVTGRPILPESDLNGLASTSSTLQTAVQAAFRIHSGQGDLKLDVARFQTQQPKQQIGYLSKHDVESNASFELSPVKPSFDALLDDSANGHKVPDSNDELDNAQVSHVAEEPVPSESVADDRTNETPSTPLVVLAFSCVAAFLALVCVALMLYVIKSLRFQMLASKRTWELLPRFWKRSASCVPEENTSATIKERPSGGWRLLHQTEVGQQHLRAEEGSVGANALQIEEKLLYFDAVSDMESEWDDVDEKYQDASDLTPLPLIHDLPLEEHLSHRPYFGNPPSLESHPPDQPKGDHSALLMRETLRPAWSVRAIDSPVLGLPSRESGSVDVTPQPLIPPRRRAYRSAVPEFDIALAMQLRPGLGIGADSAWMVRFLMAIFGWFAVAVTGSTR